MPRFLLAMLVLGMIGLAFSADRWWSPGSPESTPGAAVVAEAAVDGHSTDKTPANNAATEATLSPPTSEMPTWSSPAVGRAIHRAIRYLDGPEILDEHFIFYVLHFLERRFELGVWETMPERHQAFMNSLGDPQPQKELFRRLIESDYVATLEQLEGAEDSVDRVTVRALYCRDYPLEEDFDSQLRKLAMRGGYYQSHVAMAIQWLRENDCGSDRESIVSYVVDLMASQITVGDRSNDLEIERTAFLGYIGHGDRVPEGMVRDLVRLQNSDGGWSIKSRGGSNWHPTFLALWFLLESEGRGNGAPMIIPKRE
jgi:hypothetical protein